MVEGGENLGFAAEPSHSVGIGGELVGKDFQRDVPAQLGVPGPVDLAHAAGADGGDNLIVANTSAEVQRHQSLADDYRRPVAHRTPRIWLPKAQVYVKRNLVRAGVQESVAMNLPDPKRAPCLSGDGIVSDGYPREAVTKLAARSGTFFRTGTKDRHHSIKAVQLCATARSSMPCTDSR